MTDSDLRNCFVTTSRKINGKNEDGLNIWDKVTVIVNNKEVNVNTVEALLVAIQNGCQIKCNGKTVRPATNNPIKKNEINLDYYSKIDGYSENKEIEFAEEYLVGSNHVYNLKHNSNYYEDALQSLDDKISSIKEDLYEWSSNYCSREEFEELYNSAFEDCAQDILQAKLQPESRITKGYYCSFKVADAVNQFIDKFILQLENNSESKLIAENKDEEIISEEGITKNDYSYYNSKISGYSDNKTVILLMQNISTAADEAYYIKNQTYYNEAKKSIKEVISPIKDYLFSNLGSKYCKKDEFEILFKKLLDQIAAKVLKIYKIQEKNGTISLSYQYKVADTINIFIKELEKQLKYTTFST